MSGIFLLHSWGLAFLFVPITGLFDHHPVIEQDWGLHFHHLKSLEAFWQQDRRLWGYNPFFMAGYPSNTIQDLSIKIFEVLALALSGFGLDLIQGLKLAAFLATAAVPWMMFFAARNIFNEGNFARIVPPTAAFIGTAYWWNSLPREMFFYGMIGFPLSTYFSLLVLSLFYRLFKSERTFTPAHWGWIAAAILILPLHLQAILILAPPSVALLVLNRGNISRKLLLWLAAGTALSLLTNLIWLLPAFTHRGDDVSSTIVAELPLFVSSDPLTFLKDYLRPGGYWTFRASFWANGLRWMLLIMGLMGVLKLIRSEQRAVGIMMACSLITLFLLTYFGSLMPPLRGLQPLRFKIAFDLFLALTSSYLVGRWSLSASRDRQSVLIPLLLAGGLVAATTNIVRTESEHKMKLRTEVPQEVTALVEWIRKETPENGRILFEESGDETGFVYRGMYLSSFIPHWTGRQLIGGPINLYNDRHHFAEFHSARFFKRDIASLTEGELASYFRTYNIGAVVVFHPRSIQRLLSSRLVSVERRLGDVHLMRVTQPLNWFLEGQGQLEAGLNRIHASKIQGNVVILKYHWTQGLVSNPPATIVLVKILDDPIPFVKVINPPSEFILRVGR
ncbi:MAG TPA: hypothetical protein VGR30_20060 [Candidatus Binatia bacterium]|nr:hypothetical protein [Candidatus Binatia bacterium]